MCSVFDADGVVVDAVCVCEECEVWVMWKLHDVVGVAEGMEPVVSMVCVFECDVGSDVDSSDGA